MPWLQAVGAIAFCAPNGDKGGTKLLCGTYNGRVLFFDVERQVQELDLAFPSGGDVLCVAITAEGPSQATLAVAGKAPQ